MPATIFSGSKVKALKNRLSLNDQTEILSVSADPSSGIGQSAPLGSIAMDYLAGKVYKKTGSLATEWQELGAGLGGINYIENPDAESGISGWATYNDPSGSQPIDGTGGVADITWARSTTSPLRGVADFNLDKDAANRIGQGVSYDFTIDPADQAKVLTISFDYEILSGTYVTGDVALYIIQDTGGTPVVVQPTGYQVEAASVGTKMRAIATFQTASNVTDYRLCLHIASSSALAYSLAIDNVSVSPQQVVYGAPVTDWQDYTPVITASVTNPTIGNSTLAGKWRRVGDSMQVQITWILGSTGASGSGTYNFSLPAGFSFDANKVSGAITAAQNVLGQAFRNDAGTAFYTGNIYYQAANSVRVLSAADWSATFPHAFGSGDSMALEFVAPIQGWSSTVQMSNDTDTRVVASSYKKTANQAVTGNTTNITFDSKLYDTHSAWNGSTFRAPVPGVYVFSGVVGITSIASPNIVAFVDGVSTAAIGVAVSGNSATISGSVSLRAGQLLSFRSETNITIFGQASGLTSSFSIYRLSGPSAIAASETVAARYAKSGTQAITANTDIKLLSYSRIWDTHGGWDTSNNRYVFPISGKYLLTHSVKIPGGLTQIAAAYRINGGSSVYMNASNSSDRMLGTATVNVNAGDFLEVFVFVSSNTTVEAGDTNTFFSITRLGN